MNSAFDDRVNRLAERFSAIQQSVAEVHGEAAAFGAATCAWLMAIQNTTLYLMDLAQRGASRKEIEPAVEKMLQSLHGEICKHLKVDPQQSVDLAAHFHEIVKDITNEKG